MKKGNVTILLVVLMFIVVGFAIYIGWLTIEEQDNSLTAFEEKQSMFVEEIDSLEESLAELNHKLENTTRNLRNLEMAINSGKTTDREISSRIDNMNKELTKWQTTSKEIVSQVEELSAKIEFSESKPIEKVELGKVSVKKNVIQSVKENIEETVEEKIEETAEENVKETAKENVEENTVEEEGCE